VATQTLYVIIIIIIIIIIITIIIIIIIIIISSLHGMHMAPVGLPAACSSDFSQSNPPHHRFNDHFSMPVWIQAHIFLCLHGLDYSSYIKGMSMGVLQKHFMPDALSDKTWTQVFGGA